MNSPTLPADKNRAPERGPDRGNLPWTPPERLFIDGAWRAPLEGGHRDVVNPATGRVVARVAEAGVSDVAEAVRAARRAFDGGDWSTRPGRERARVLGRVAELIHQHTEELALLESIDTGKPIQLCTVIDVGSVADLVAYYAALAWSIDGATRQTRAPLFAYTRREPVGVVAAISPYNFPLVLSLVKIAPALAAGNTVIHKSAPDTPLTALRMAELLAEAGVPAGVFNVLTGGGEVGEELVGHPEVDMVAFTGSTSVGRRVAALAAETLKRVTVELGGKSANIVFDDADLGPAIESSVGAFVFNTGQFCAAGTRLLVQRGVYDDVLAGVTAGARGVPVGDPLSPATVVGPMSGERQLANVRGRVEAAVRDQGATLHAGDGPVPNGGGFYFAPTVLTGVDQNSPVVREEIFGPVLTVQPFDTEEEAVELANDTRYGLAAGLHTRDVKRMHRVADRLRAGTVWVNTWGMLDATMPFGGCKESGYGREQGPEGLHEYTQTKAVFVAM